MGFLSKIGVVAHNAMTKGRVVLDENGPKMAIYGGAAALVGAVVLTGKQSIKAYEVIEQHKKDVQAITTAANDEIYGAKYTQEMAQTDIKKANINMIKDFVHIYRGPILLSVVGLTGILCGTNKLDKKVRDLTVSVAAISQAWTEYRKRVANAVGTETEQDLYLGTDVSKVEVLDENGHPITKAEQIIKKNDADKLKKNPYIFEFGPQTWYGAENTVFDKSAPSYNILNVRGVLRDAQRDLELYGQVWVRDIYKKLGNKKCPALLMNAGWVVERDSEGKIYAPIGDAKIDFGLIDNVEFYCDSFDLNEEEVGIASANPIMMCFNCCDIRGYLYNKEKKQFAIA